MDLAKYEEFLMVGDAGKQPKSLETVRNYTDAIKRFLRDYQLDFQKFLGSADVAEAEGRRILTRLRLDRPSVNAYNLGQKALNQLARACGHRHLRWEKMPENKTQPRPFTPDELHRLLTYRSRRPGWKGRQETRRRRALVWEAIYTAKRHGEIHRSEASHYDPIASTYTILKPSKNGDVRTIPVEPEFYSTGRPFMGWLTDHPVCPSHPNRVWTTSIRWGRRPATPKCLSYPQLLDEFKEVGRSVGVDVNFYRTRATRATMCKRAGMEDRSIQKILGHAKLETTVRYVQHLMLDVEADLRRHKPASPIKRQPTGV